MLPRAGWRAVRADGYPAGGLGRFPGAAPTFQFSLAVPCQYCIKSQSFVAGANMETSEWVARCSARLHAQWPRLQREQRDEVARDLWNDERWQGREPEVAVVEWLRQGIPAPVGSQR